MYEPDFPVLKIGSRMVAPKEAFIQWDTKHTEGGVRKNDFSDLSERLKNVSILAA